MKPVIRFSGCNYDIYPNICLPIYYNQNVYCNGNKLNLMWIRRENSFLYHFISHIPFHLSQDNVHFHFPIIPFKIFIMYSIVSFHRPLYWNIFYKLWCHWRHIKTISTFPRRKVYLQHRINVCTIKYKLRTEFAFLLRNVCHFNVCP